MRILVVGAGAIGGYFGGRMLQAGRDVTFLVRPAARRRARRRRPRDQEPERRRDTEKSADGAGRRLAEKFDAVLLSCKAFDLDDAIESFAPAVGPQTAIIPLLNGMLHLDVLDKKFGAERVLGGLCAIAATLERAARGGAAQADAVAQFRRTRRQAVGARARDRRSDDGRQHRRCRQRKHRAGDVGEVGVFGLARGLDLPDAHLRRQHPGGTGGKDFILGMLDECSAVASAEGHAPSGPFFQRTRGMLTAEGSQMTASMFRDIKAGAAVEADHVIGDLIARGDAAKVPVPRLRTAYIHLKAYEKQRG